MAKAAEKIEDKVEVEETQSGFDMDAATADISSSLFGQGDDEETKSVDKPIEGEEGKLSGEPSADVVELPPQTDKVAEKPVEETSKEVQAVGAPQTWTKEALETWATIPPRAQTEILKREEDFLKGITQYKEAADIGRAYDAVVDPYKPILQAEGIDPVQMFQSFSANHYLLSRGTPQQKIELAANLLTGYNIPLPELLNFMADSLDAPATDPQVTALVKEVGELRNFITTAQKTTTAQTTDALLREIETFASDPAHPHFNELANDINKLFEAGLATSLEEAYEKAVFANPATRQKEIDRLTTEAKTAEAAELQARKDKKARLTGDSVIVTPKSRDGTVLVGSIDDTLSETLAAINQRG